MNIKLMVIILPLNQTFQEKKYKKNFRINIQSHSVQISELFIMLWVSRQNASAKKAHRILINK